MKVKYVIECDKIKHNQNEKYNFLKEVFAVYGDEIGNIHEGLDLYTYHFEGEGIDYDGDIVKIKAKLINYKDNLELEAVMTKEEKEDLEDKVSGIDAAVKSGKKDRAKEKIVDVLKFLADKGSDALIAMK